MNKCLHSITCHSFINPRNKTIDTRTFNFTNIRIIFIVNLQIFIQWDYILVFCQTILEWSASKRTSKPKVCFSNPNKTGTRQCTRAVWSTFADIHSTHPGAFDAVRWGYWNFRLKFMMPYKSKHTRDEPKLSYDCDLITAFIGFPFALVFTCTFTECVTNITKYIHELDGYNNEFGLFFKMCLIDLAVFTRDTFTWSKLTLLLYCITFSIVKWHLALVNVSCVNTAFSRLNLTRESSFKGTLDWALANVFELIPNEFGTVFELDVQRLETSEQLRLVFNNDGSRSSL